MKPQHIFIKEGATKTGEVFQFYQKGNVIQLYWDDGEMSETNIPLGSTAQDVVLEWGNEIMTELG